MLATMMTIMMMMTNDGDDDAAAAGNDDDDDDDDGDLDVEEAVWWKEGGRIIERGGVQRAIRCDSHVSQWLSM